MSLFHVYKSNLDSKLKCYKTEATELINQVAPLRNSGLMSSTASIQLPNYTAFIQYTQHVSVGDEMKQEINSVHTYRGSPIPLPRMQQQLCGVVAGTDQRPRTVQADPGGGRQGVPGHHCPCTGGDTSRPAVRHQWGE